MYADELQAEANSGVPDDGYTAMFRPMSEENPYLRWICPNITNQTLTFNEIELWAVIAPCDKSVSYQESGYAQNESCDEEAYSGTLNIFVRAISSNFEPSRYF